MADSRARKSPQSKGSPNTKPEGLGDEEILSSFSNHSNPDANRDKTCIVINRDFP